MYFKKPLIQWNNRERYMHYRVDKRHFEPLKNIQEKLPTVLDLYVLQQTQITLILKGK